MKGALVTAAAFATLSYTAAAQACPVCFQSKNDDNRIAFIVTTAFLTVLPLLLIGGLVWWLHGKYKAAEAAEAEESTHLGEPADGVLPGVGGSPAE